MTAIILRAAGWNTAALAVIFVVASEINADVRWWEIITVWALFSFLIFTPATVPDLLWGAGDEGAKNGSKVPG